MDTNTLNYTNAVAAMQSVVSDPSITDAFNQGLYLGFVILAACVGFFMLKSAIPDDREEL